MQFGYSGNFTHCTQIAFVVIVIWAFVGNTAICVHSRPNNLKTMAKDGGITRQALGILAQIAMELSDLVGGRRL